MPDVLVAVGDELEFVYRLTGVETQPALRAQRRRPYPRRIDERRALDRELLVQPDGMITLRHARTGPRRARTVTELRDELEQRYTQVLQGAGHHGHSRASEHTAGGTAGGGR